MTKLPRPPGHHTITPSFIVPGVAEVMTFLEKAFGAEVVERYAGPNDSVAHAEMRIGDSVVMMGEPMGEMKPMPASLSLYVDDGKAVDTAYARALEAGANSISEPADQFYGYRSAQVVDGGGNRWNICAIVEELTREQIEERMAEMMKG